MSDIPTKPRLLALDAGHSYHRTSLEGRYRSFFDEIAYLRAPEPVPLEHFDAVLVPCRTPARLLEPLAGRLKGFLHSGGTLIAMGETAPQRWLPGIRIDPRATNYWWWLDKDSYLGIEIAQPTHPLFGHLHLKDCIWHIHAVLTPPPGVPPLLSAACGGSLLYDDRVSFEGRLIITTLDPFYHHGSHFMPATTRFLDGFLRWLRSSEGIALRSRPLERRAIGA
ncbi:MAG: hypothetical protein AAFY56_23645 [Pseudomonadota bacterium]